LQLEHTTSFVFEFVALRFINQTASLRKVAAGACSNLKTLADS
jgi:hypothetical protein